MIELEIVNPLNYPKWNELLLSNPNCSFFHSSNWARVLHESYHYNPLYFTLIDEEKLLVAIPLMEIKSILTGQRGISLPFSDYCDPIISKDIHFKDILDYLINYGKQAGWKFIEVRGGSNFFQELSRHSSYYYNHIVELSHNEKQVFSNFRSNTKRNIKKAIREGVKVNLCNSLESINEFNRLNCITRRMHGLPPQPYYFFKKIYDYIISKNNGIIMLASHKGKTIAGAVYFHFGEKAIYKYGASDRRYQHLRANNLVMWEAIKWYARNGYKSFYLGRTAPENKGLLRFKAGWGVKKQIIKYYKYDFNKKTFVRDSSKISELHKSFFRGMPIPLLKITGSLLYRHVG